MSTLTFLRNYNNYYNRMIKHDFLSTTMSAYESETFNNINFNPGDGIFTEQIINWNNSWLPDYLLVDAVKNNPATSIVETGVTEFYINIADVRKFTASNYQALVTANFYNATTKELDLSRISNYENDNYDQVLFGIEGEWPLNQFSIKINTPNGVTVNIWSDSNDFTFTVESETITEDFLKKLGWADNENVWGITIWGASPDTFYGTAKCEDYNTKWAIGSSWFVMQADRTRKGQYRLTLKRDNIADHYDTIINSPAYIEKATIKNFNDPAIFNKEDLFVNQIKKQEKLLKDKTNMAWLVAWINNNIAQETWTDLFNQKSVPYTRNIDTGVDYETNDISSWVSSHQLSGTYKCLKETDDYMWFKVQNEYFESSARILWAWMNYKIYRDKNHEAEGGIGGHRGDSYRYNFKDETPFGTMISQTETINDQLFNAVQAAEGFILGTDSRFNYINKIIKETKDSVVKYYKIESSYSDWNSSVTYGNTSAIANLFTNLPDGQKNTVSVTFKGDYVTFSYRDITNEMATTANIYADVSSVVPRNSGLIDAPYMAVCIPYTLNESLTGEPRQDVISDGSFNARIDSTKAFAAITLLSYCLQDGEHLYDVQLLPYCPMVNEINISGPYHDSYMINAAEIAANRKIKFYQTDGSTFDTTTPLMEAYIFFNSSFTFDIPLAIYDKGTVFEKKLASETELYRFNSPNYSAFFDFNPYMNNGMTKLNVDCTYKPYKSYIHMNPDFKGLYGSDFNDARGLVITSDFSIPQVTDAWQTYQIQNKNYADIFARNQQHLKVEQKWSEAEAGMNMITAPLAGGVTGGIAGGMKGGMYGAIAGAVVGTGMGLAGGIADYAKTKELNQEALDYNRDMYNYNLQNIQALPQTLSSISSYDANNKLWPFLETYECSDVEKEAMRNKLIYNGMKVGRIDTINSFISTTSNYIKAQLIRNEISSLDYNELNDIGLELDKGVFM